MGSGALVGAPSLSGGAALEYAEAMVAAPHSPPSSAALTPFVETLAARVESAALTVLGLDAASGARAEVAPPRTSDGWLVVATVPGGEGPAVEVELAPAGGEGPAWIRGPRYAASYRMLDGGVDPLSRPATRTRLEAVAARLQGPIAGADALQEALDGFLPFAGLADRMYRQISVNPDGVAVATLRLGFRCNQDCGFCWQARGWPEPPAEYYERWLDEIAAQGVRSLSISGGEPTLHKALPAIAARATHEHGMAVQLQTNAIRFGRPKFLQTMVDAGVRDLFVSLHSPRPEVSDRMTRAPGTHGPTVKGIEASLAAGIVVRLNCVVDRQNHDHLGEHARAVVARFAEPFPHNPVRDVTYTFPCDYHDRDLFRASVVPLDSIRPHLIEALAVLKQAGIRTFSLGTCGFPPCILRDRPELLSSAELGGAEQGPDGVRAADPDAHGNLLLDEVPLKVDEMDASGRSHGKVCDDCALRSRCLGVRREYLQVYGEAGLRAFAEVPAALR